MIPSTPTSASPRPRRNGGAQILRRGYSFTDGIDAAHRPARRRPVLHLPSSATRAGQFVPIQRRLGADDALNEYIQHTGSGLFAVPPGVRRRAATWASGLFA